ncbi:similar to Saccharomyces cerevisiae YHR140W Putative integral membrane protein of unknown function [Maudiozyma barnettii]|uniref:Uncharacterized protein n=1 Tax=Maudiozyma barnettii TaxID=61262 RepID=A0A8H2VHM8_9SACH|nr:hypothetical protein [Kazachstania barnettii]CAB4255642.1 similar to Saccharomyces cerevisiae YHR140W Putative integral membrane protein of unknown function [Kazachstania barnettii]CAD1784203.1 similar to Saccharomyces cerevisiae YHR140W Putative integral membrane protein of unknown function [Kazachstania barnettii]
MSLNNEKPSEPSCRSLIINVLSLFVGSWGLSQATTLILPPSLKDAGHKQFLTNISVVATLISNVWNISNYFIQRSNLNINLLRVSNFISRHLVLPIALILETVVPIVYWPLRLFAMKLIMQGVSDGKSPVPLSVDLSIHFFPCIFLLCDHYLSGTGNKFMISNRHAWFLVIILGMAYYKYLAFLINPSIGQKYPYPFLDVVEPYKSIIFVCVTTVAWSFYVFYQKFAPCSKSDDKSKITKKQN